MNLLEVFLISERKGAGRNDERGGCPKSTQTDINSSAVAGFVENDLRVASRMIVESLNIRCTVVLWILKVDFGNRILCARFVSDRLTTE